MNNFAKPQNTSKDMQKRLADAKQIVNPRNYVRPSSANSKVKNTLDKNHILMQYDNNNLDFAMKRMGPGMTTKASGSRT